MAVKALTVAPAADTDDTQIISVCGYCRIAYAAKPGRGVSGISHGCCPGCAGLTEAERETLVRIQLTRRQSCG